MVKCPRCKEDKEKEEFYINLSRSTGISSHCKSCVLKYHKSNYDSSLIKIKNRKANLKRKYNLTLQEFEDMKEAQDNCCFICSERVSLVVDHNHNTGKVRKLLCLNCNSGLGMFREKIELLLKAAEYVSSQN